MKILVATDMGTRGGVDNYVRQIVPALAADGHEVVLAVEETTTSPLGLELKGGVEVHRLPLTDGAVPHAVVSGAAQALLDQVAPDGLYVVCGAPLACEVLRVQAHRRGCRVVVTEQFVPRQLDRWYDPDSVARLERLYAAEDGVIFVSRMNLETMRQHVALDDSKTHLIHNALPADCDLRVAPKRSRPPADPMRVMMAGRLTDEKGVDVLIRAMALVPTGTCTTDIVGEGPGRDGYAALVRELRLSGSTHLHPSSDDIVGELDRHDVFVLPSRDEGMRYVLLEGHGRRHPDRRGPNRRGGRGVARGSGRHIVRHR